MKFSEVNCPVCGQNDYKVVVPDTLGEKPPVFGYKWTPEIRKCYRAVRCKNCSHMYSSPRLEDMYAYYQDVADEGYLKNSHLRTGAARNVIKTIRKLNPEGRLLDVGSSTGDFLREAQRYYEVEGLELSNWASKIAIDAGLKIHKKKLADLARNDQTYDIITMWGVIEHLEFPREEIKHVHKLLKPEGIFCFWTGDSSSIFLKIFGKNWWYILGQHIQYFSNQSVDYLMRGNEFEKIFIRIYPYVMSLGYLGTSLSRYPIVGPLANKILKLESLKNRTFNFYLPGEMFGVYLKR